MTKRLAFAVLLLACSPAKSPATEKAELDAALAEHRWLWKACHEAAEKREPGLVAEAKITLRIATDGSVERATAICSSASPRLTTCLVEASRAIRFKPRSAPLAFTQPLSFGSNKPGACPAASPELADWRAPTLEEGAEMNAWRVDRCAVLAREKGFPEDGHVGLVVSIDASGAATARVGCSTLPKAVAGCVADAFNAIKFDKSAAVGSTVVPVRVGAPKEPPCEVPKSFL